MADLWREYLGTPNPELDTEELLGSGR